MDNEFSPQHRRCIPLTADQLARWRGDPPARRKNRTPLALAIAVACPALGGAQAPAPPPSLASLDCLIQPSQTVQVGTATAGVIQAVRAERGDYVRRGQTLVQLESQVERAALAVAREKATQLGEMQATRGASELAQRELERAADLVKENFVSRTYFDRQKAEVEVASGRGQQAEERRRLAEREVQLATAQLAQRTVTSPVDGVVVERHVGPGEYVEQKPVMRIAQIDPLRVDVLVPAAAFGQVAVGAKAQVTPEMLQRQARTAVVTGVDRVIDAASNTYRVRLELPNPGGRLPPGLRCKADLVAMAADNRSDLPPAAPSGSTAPAGPVAPVLPAAPVPTPQALEPRPELPGPTPEKSTSALRQIERELERLAQAREAASPAPAGLRLKPQPQPELSVAASHRLPTHTATQVAYEPPPTAAEIVAETQRLAALQHPRLKLTWPEPPVAVAAR